MDLLGRVFGRKNALSQADGTHAHLDARAYMVFQDVVDTIVDALSFRAAMLAIVEPHDETTTRLTVKAFATSVTVVNDNRFRNAVGKSLIEAGEMLSGAKLIDNYVLMNDTSRNVAVDAILNGLPFARTQRLHDLFTPVVQPQISDLLQRLAGINDLITVPFRNREGELIGNLYAGSEKDIGFSKREQLIKFSKMATIAVENVILLSRQHVVNNRIGFLEDIIKLMALSMKEKEILKSIARSAVHHLGFELCLVAIARKQPDGAVVLEFASWHFRDDIPDTDQRYIATRFKSIQLVLTGSSGEQVTVSNLAIEAIRNHQEYVLVEHLSQLLSPSLSTDTANYIVNTCNLRNLISIPVRRHEQELIGNIIVGSRRSVITPDEIQQLRTLVFAMATALENSEYVRETNRMGLFATNIGDLAHHVNGQLFHTTTEVERLYETLESEVQRLEGGAETLSETESALIHSLKSTVERLNTIADKIEKSNQLIRNVRHYVQQKDISSTELRILTVEQELLRAWDSLSNPSYDQNQAYSRPDNVRLVRHPDTFKRDVLVEATNELREVFRNILKNACEALDRGGVIVYRIQPFLPTGDNAPRQVRIVFVDNGPGIPVAQREDIFKLKTTSTKGGLGYGLWAARYVVSLFGGDIALESKTIDEKRDAALTPAGYFREFDSGTAFIITLPVYEDSGS